MFFQVKPAFLIHVMKLKMYERKLLTFLTAERLKFLAIRRQNAFNKRAKNENIFFIHNNNFFLIKSLFIDTKYYFILLKDKKLFKKVFLIFFFKKNDTNLYGSVKLGKRIREKARLKRFELETFLNEKKISLWYKKIHQEEIKD